MGSLALLGATKAKMSADNTDVQDLLQNADQLFDENQYQEVIDILKKHPVSTNQLSINFHTFFRFFFKIKFYSNHRINPMQIFCGVKREHCTNYLERTRQRKRRALKRASK